MSVPPTAGSAVGYLHFRHVPIEGVFEPDPAGRVAFREAAGLDETAFAEVQERGCRRLLRVFMRRGLLTGNDERVRHGAVGTRWRVFRGRQGFHVEGGGQFG
jgi:hypothetical protein